MTTSDCTFSHSMYCDQQLRKGPYNEPYGTGVTNETQQDHDEQLSDVAPPDCTAPKNAKERAYCLGQDPQGSQLTLIQNALDRMKAKGGICSDLADIAYRLVSGHHLKVYADSLGPGFGGAAPLNGSHYHPENNEWMVLAQSWVTQYPDAAHATRPGVDNYAPRDLQQALAHELDHLNGENHLTTSPAQTANSMACSDLP